MPSRRRRYWSTAARRGEMPADLYFHTLHLLRFGGRADGSRAAAGARRRVEPTCQAVTPVPTMMKAPVNTRVQ